MVLCCVYSFSKTLIDKISKILILNFCNFSASIAEAVEFEIFKAQVCKCISLAFTSVAIMFKVKQK